jgi:hypothetical protein
VYLSDKRLRGRSITRSQAAVPPEVTSPASASYTQMVFSADQDTMRIPSEDDASQYTI